MLIDQYLKHTKYYYVVTEGNRSLSLQFIIYGSYYATISVLFLIRGTYTACAHHYYPEKTEAKEQENEPSVEVIAAERF